MSAHDASHTPGPTRLSFGDPDEAGRFAETLARFERGEIGPDEWRTFRLVHGTYGQRQDGVHMVRAKIPQGILDGAQLHALADVAERFSRGFGHVTTRQNVQLHFVDVQDVAPAIARLAEAGLTTREACGNSVRNVTACPLSGVAADEPFDVGPYAEALTRHLLRHPLSSSLPRKMKIAFEGCARDHAATAINDIGFRARRRDGRNGFRVTVGGGTATLCRSGQELLPFVPASDLLGVAEAVVRVFHRLGDRQHRQRNRLKFLLRDMGWDAWREAFDAAWRAILAGGAPGLPFDPDAPAPERPTAGRPAPPSIADVRRWASAAVRRGPGPHPAVVPAPAFREWLRTNVRPQRQRGYAVATVTLPLGDVTGAQLRVLATLAAAYSDGTVRTTGEQDLLLRWVPQADLDGLFARLAAAGLGAAGAATLDDVTSCPGAEACRLAVTQSRGLGRLLADHLRARPELARAVPGLDVKISGCPNGCGQHHVAGIGLQGSVRRAGDRVVPQYFVFVGGGFDDSGARFARLVAKVPARRVPAAIERLLDLHRQAARDGETAPEFFRRIEPAAIKPLLADLETFDAGTAPPEDFVDLGEEQPFELSATEGECAR